MEIVSMGNSFHKCSYEVEQRNGMIARKNCTRVCLEADGNDSRGKEHLMTNRPVSHVRLLIS